MLYASDISRTHIAYRIRKMPLIPYIKLTYYASVLIFLLVAGSRTYTVEWQTLGILALKLGECGLVYVLCRSSAWDLEIYNLSYLWFSATGCVTVIVVGVMVSFITGQQDLRKLNPKTISPAVFWFKSILPAIGELGEDFVSYYYTKLAAENSNYEVCHIGSWCKWIARSLWSIS